jgi:HK97 family phage prohead protease
LTCDRDEDAMKTREDRFLARPPEIQTRADGDKAQQIGGYAAVFYRADDPGTEYTIPLWDGWTMRERIMPGAFDAALKSGRDIIALWNHDSGKPLGRRSRGTLTLTADATGLAYTVDPPGTSWGRDAVEAVTRGDVQGSSFGFRVSSVDETVTEDAKAKTITRTIRSIGSLVEVSPVSVPAYQATTSQVREDNPDLAAMIDKAAERERAEQAALAEQKRKDEDFRARMRITAALAMFVE